MARRPRFWEGRAMRLRRSVPVLVLAALFGAPASAHAVADASVTYAATGGTLTYVASAATASSTSWTLVPDGGFLSWDLSVATNQPTTQNGGGCTIGSSGDYFTCGAVPTTIVATLTGLADHFDAAEAFAFLGGPTFSVDAGAGDDDLVGGVDGDVLHGGAGDDHLNGGADLGGFPPGDTLDGGAGVDVADYSLRGDALSLSLNGVDDDGAPDEHDRLVGIEDVVGGSGNDVITGDAGANALAGGAGDDQLTGGAGSDDLSGGEGNDAIDSRDGVPDGVRCGRGTDTAQVDAFDVVSGCETVSATRDLMPDADADGVAAPADCNDHDASIRPGLVDVAGNGKDEDCSGADATTARAPGSATASFKRTGRAFKVRSLKVAGLAPGSVVAVSCKGKGCPRTLPPRGLPSGGRAVLTRMFPKALGAKSVITVRILQAGRIGSSWRWTLPKKGRAPGPVTGCLAPDTTRPTAC
jgi:hypothetical protein